MNRFDKYLSLPGILISALFIILCGCSKKVLVPVENTVVRTDTVVRNVFAERVDTFLSASQVYTYILDSIAPVTDSAGNIIRLDRFRIERFSDSSDRIQKSMYGRVDSLMMARLDSVRYPVVKEVPAELSGSQKFKLGFFPVGVCCAVLMVCTVVFVFFRMSSKNKS